MFFDITASECNRRTEPSWVKIGKWTAPCLTGGTSIKSKGLSVPRTNEIIAHFSLARRQLVCFVMNLSGVYTLKHSLLFRSVDRIDEPPVRPTLPGFVMVCTPSPRLNTFVGVQVSPCMGRPRFPGGSRRDHSVNQVPCILIAAEM